MSKHGTPPNFLERVQRCNYCGREMAIDALSFLENPFCEICLPERMGLTDTFPGEVRWRVVGDYAEIIPKAPQRPS